METLLEAMARLRALGYEADLVAEGGGRLRCCSCGAVVAASTIAADETVRFEGESDPDDEVILVALVSPCGHRGLYASAYGPDLSVEDAGVLRALAG